MATRRVPGGVLVVALVACGGVEASGGGETSEGSSTGGGAGAMESSSEGSNDDSTSLPPLPDPSAGSGPSMPSQTALCKVWVACAMALMDPNVDAIIDEYGSLGTCWLDTATAAACDDACTASLDMAHAAADASGEVLPDACDPPRDVPLSEVEGIIFANCVDDCHEPGGEYPSLDLSSDPRVELIRTYGAQAIIPYVRPGDHEESYLWHKISGTQGSAGGSGSRMPDGQPPLDDAEIDAIADWIDIGAPP